MPSTTPVSFTTHDLERWLSPSSLHKAFNYVDSVSQARWTDGVLQGLVQGTAARPYRVEIDVSRSLRDHAGRLYDQCNCPVGHACKHVAALLLAGMDPQLASDGPSGNGGDNNGDMSEHRQQPTSELLQQLSNWHVGHAGRTTELRHARPRVEHGLAYVLFPTGHRLGILVHKTRRDHSGNLQMQDFIAVEPRLFLAPPTYVASADVAILAQLSVLQDDGMASRRVAVTPLLEAIVATGRGWVRGRNGGVHVPAIPGPARSATLRWEEHAEDEDLEPGLAPTVMLEGTAHAVISGASACYLDDVTGEVGPLQLPVAAYDADAFLSLPVLNRREYILTAKALQHIDPALPRPPAPTERIDEQDDDAAPRPEDAPPHPILTLHSVEYRPAWAGRNDPSNWMDFATLSIQYGEELVAVDDPRMFRRDSDEQYRLIPRDRVQEAHWKQQLFTHGLRTDVPPLPQTGIPGPWFQPRATSWQAVVTQVLPQLRSAGWEVVVEPEFRHQITVVDDISLEVTPGAEGWFDLALDIEVDGRKLALAPLLERLLEEDARWSRGNLDAIGDDEAIIVRGEGNEALLLQAGRLKPVVALLGDLFAGGREKLRVATHDAGRLQALQDSARLQFRSSDDTRAMVERLLAGPGVLEVQPPEGLKASLRGYQRQGLAWLQFLRAQKLAGVLADDMGLGKTLQTLAHILLEKEAGRLDRPALLVMPTTLLHNWQAEAARFTPSLRVLVLHGPQRQALFEQIPLHDVVLTTYPLVWRDEEALAAFNYHLLALDEAQHVKNARARSAIALRRLYSRHRLCLSGTPLENHLGELWAHFDFLLPGLLGDEKSFNQHWRHPIERGPDPLRARLLAQRLRPFILRRRKQDVATELPPKTVIVRSIALEGGQRDLYETVRTAMETKVREALSSKGLARSHIVVLDALLKLRQACCDPRLLPGVTTGRSPPSAKLDMLMDMLPEMIEEGRRILLFSQFTSMLDLIGQALDAAGIPHVTLTGDTRDRSTPINAFTQGDVPLFLVSLKAGGVGLNLTAADTVIHYDPWWNPAAEEQASDRAHRIGQDKPVFVYKLIAAGSIEERIVALQERKAALADAILGEGGTAAPRFAAEDLEALLAPLPETAPGPPPKPRRRRKG